MNNFQKHSVDAKKRTEMFCAIWTSASSQDTQIGFLAWPPLMSRRSVSVSPERTMLYAAHFTRVTAAVRTSVAAYFRSWLLGEVADRLRVDKQFLSIRYADLVENIRQMMPYGTVRDTESMSDVLI